ncbi:MAG TPA: hypothetical protein VK494_03060 [Gemmatimonadaceae bacterium]|nr:hypothetical protein [Gemmatimonadaceae bacterium]
MAHFRSTLAVFSLASAIISHRAHAQQASSVSVMHTVSVTVPPRVKVELTRVASAPQNGVRISSRQAVPSALSLTISATQSWTLSIGSAAGRSQHQWSLDRNAGFAPVTTQNSTVAAGTLSEIPAAATVFFRNSNTASSGPGDRAADDSDAVLLTIVSP